jgi:hypothetical protein
MQTKERKRHGSSRFDPAVLDAISARPTNLGGLMTTLRQPRTKSELLKILKRAGYSTETIEALDSALPDVFEPARYESLLARYGVTPGELSERMGSSP